MQFKIFTAIALVCMTTLVSAAPMQVAPQVAPVNVARDITVEVAREPSPEPAPKPLCSRYVCL